MTSLRSSHTGEEHMQEAKADTTATSLTTSNTRPKVPSLRGSPSPCCSMLLPYAVPHDAFWNLREPATPWTMRLNAKSTTFRRHSKLPTAYALPKGKKDFQSGRPIVSFGEAFMRPLLEATARPLYGLCAIAFPWPVAKADVYELWT